jgi:hypothetical protein
VTRLKIVLGTAHGLNFLHTGGLSISQAVNFCLILEPLWVYYECFLRKIGELVDYLRIELIVPASSIGDLVGFLRNLLGCRWVILRNFVNYLDMDGLYTLLS